MDAPIADPTAEAIAFLRCLHSASDSHLTGSLPTGQS